MSRSDKHTFEMLDVIRGLAAIIVAERHLSYYFFDKRWPGSYLAVDIFFVLSGFVLAHAYEARFAAGLRWPKFLLMRLIRLYPLYLAASLLGLGTMWYADALPENLPLVIGLGIFFLPLLSSPTLYPLDNPTWTLLLELVANVAHAALAPRLSNRVLHILIGSSGALLIAVTLYFGDLDVGHRPATFVAGIPRMCFSYFMGVRLYRAWCARAVHAVPATWAIVVGILIVMMLPISLAYRAYYDLVAVIVLIPALIYHAASARLDVVGKKWLLPLGAASYAYYVLHVPFGMFCDVMARRVGIDLIAHAPWDGLVIFAALLSVSLMLDIYYDLPVRRWLMRRLTSQKTS